MFLLDLSGDLKYYLLLLQNCALGVSHAEVGSFYFGSILSWILGIGLVSDLSFDGGEQSFERSTGCACLQITDFFVIPVENWLVALVDYVEVEVGLAVVGESAGKGDVLFGYDLWFFEAGEGGDVDGVCSVLAGTWRVLRGELYHRLLERSIVLIELEVDFSGGIVLHLFIG